MTQLLGRYVVQKAITYGAEYFIDNFIKDKVIEPAIGGVVFCDLSLGYAEHSGVYLGDGNIMELNSSGDISVVSYEGFMEGLTGKNIYTSCYNTVPIGSKEIAQRALRYQKEINDKDYNLVLNNCHILSSSCITGDTDNSNTFLWMLKDDCEKYMGVNNWRIWEYRPECELTVSPKTMNELFSSYTEAQVGLMKKSNELGMKMLKHLHKPQLLNFFKSFEDMLDDTDDELIEMELQSQILEQVARDLEENIDVILSKLDS